MTKRKTETVNDLSRCLDPLDMDATLIAVIEMSQSSWLVAGTVPGVERQPLKKITIDEHALLKLLSRWREEAEKNLEMLLVGRLQITTVGAVADEGFVAATQSATQMAQHRLAHLGVALGLGEVAADNVAATADANLLPPVRCRAVRGAG